MAYGDAYATVQRFNAQTGGREEGAVILSKLLATSRWLERRLGVESFNRSGSVSARVLIAEADESGYAQSVLRTPPIATLTGVVVKVDSDNDGSFADETALVDGTDYELLPRDAADRAEAVPWTEIRLTGWGSYGTTWPVGARVQVTAEWGWPAVPEAIVSACVEFTRMVMGEGIFATNRISDLNQVETVSAQARSILKDLMMVYSPTAGIGVA